MTLEQILTHRRAVRKYDRRKEIDTDKVKECIRLSTLAPTSSNMQLWEAYHITDEKTLDALATACLGQSSASTCRQTVVFVTTPGKWKAHAKAVAEANIRDINENCPDCHKARRVKLQKQYYGKLIPIVYSRFLGLLGLLRMAVAQTTGLFRPITRQVGESDQNTVVHKSCALAAMTFMLAMSEHGYDTCPLEGFDSLRVKKILGLPRDCGINMIITCGVRADNETLGKRFRLPFSEFYHHI